MHRGGDTFFSAVALGLFGDASMRLRVRKACLMHFIEAVFEVPPDIKSIEEFMEQAGDYPLRAGCFRDLAVQMWVRRLHAMPKYETIVPDTSYRFFLIDPVKYHRMALEFVAFNSRAGYLSCRFTFAYLVCATQRCDVTLVEQDGMHQPTIQYDGMMRGYTPDDKIAHSGKHIYIQRHAQSYILLMQPQDGEMPEPIYQLRCTDQHTKNWHVSDLMPVGAIHSCRVEHSSPLTFQIFPARPNDLCLPIPKDAEFFVFLLRNPTDPSAECICKIKHALVYPYFQMDADVYMVVVLTAPSYKKAQKMVKRELGIKNVH